MACGMARLPVAVAVATALVAPALVAAVGPDVWQQGELAGALDGGRDLVLVAAARARDAARADLASVRDELPQRGDVLVVDELHLVAAVRAGLATAAAGPALPITPARRPAALLRHCWNPSLGSLELVARRRPRPGEDTAQAAMPTREGSEKPYTDARRNGSGRPGAGARRTGRPGAWAEIGG